MKTNSIILALLLCATLIRATIFFSCAPWRSRFQYPDEREYHQLGREMIENHKFDSTFRVPGYPGMISLIYGMFGVHPDLVFVSQIILNIATILAVYILAFRLFSRRVGEIAAFLYMLDPLPAFYAMTLLSDTVFSFVFFVALSVFLLGMKQPRVISCGLSGLLLGLSMLIRPLAQYIPILLFPVCLVCIKAKFHYRLKYAMVFIVFAAVAVIPWVGRNYIRHGAWELTTQVGHNMLYDNASLLESNRTHTPLPEVQKRLMGVIDRMNISNPFEKSTVQTKCAISLIREHPIDYVLIHVRGMINLYFSPDTRSILNLMGRKPSEFPDGFVITSSLATMMLTFFKYKSSLEIFMGLFMMLLWIVVYVCTIVGFVGLFQKREWVTFIVLLGTVVYFTVITGPIGYGRLKLPIIPVYSVVAAYCFRKVEKSYRTYGESHIEDVIERA